MVTNRLIWPPLNGVKLKITATLAIKVIDGAFCVLNHYFPSYYKQQAAVPIHTETQLIIDKIIAIHDDNLQSYGRRRMLKSLHKEGVNIGVFKVARLMREAGIVAKTPNKPHYYPSGNEKPNIPNLLKREFNPATINTHWVGDITYIRNHQGWSYLATVLDLGNKRNCWLCTFKNS